MKQILIEEYTANYNENNWVVSIRNAIAGLTAGQAAWRPGGADNTIWEVVNHLIFWNERWLRGFRGLLDHPEENVTIDSFKSDWGDWQATSEKLYAVMDEWREQLDSATDERLTSPVNDQYSVPWFSPLAQQNIHNAYHTGQIVLLRKLQGSWYRSNGVS